MMRKTWTSGPSIALFAALLALATVAAVATADEAVAQQEAWVLDEIIINPEDHPTDFVGGGETPGWFEEPRYEGTFERYEISDETIVHRSRRVDTGEERWNMTTTVAITGPPEVLVAGDEATVSANLTAGGSYAWPWNPFDRFEFRAAGVGLVGERSAAVGMNPDYYPRTAAVNPTFTVPVPWSDEAEFRIAGVLWNCAACSVQWVYRVDTQPAARCKGRLATITAPPGTVGARLVGTPGDDVIVGTPGDDHIDGRGGRDLVCGRAGDDVISGGAGADRLFGEGGDDTIRGGSGNDRMSGGPGKDTLVGGPGRDVALGGPGTDRCAAEREKSCEREPAIDGPLVEWTMPDRYGDASPDGIVRPTRNPFPQRFRVEFELRRGNGKRCAPDDAVRARSREGTFRTPRPQRPCTIVGRFPEGTHRVVFDLATKAGRGRTIVEVVVQDWLIVGIGDSNGSGEGTPDIPRAPRRRARWVDRQCHRSANSHQALSAATLERRDPETSVTFVHLACSGAQIRNGLLQPYAGQEPDQGPRLQPQLDELDRIADRREVDAVLVSAGVNDLRFGDVVEFCITWYDCPNRRWQTGSDQRLAQVMDRYVAQLPGLYERLARRLERAGIPANRVYITEYFDSTNDANGDRCDPLIRVGAGSTSLDFDRAEATWAADSILGPLNDAVRAAATRHGWTIVRGAERGFVPHGYCAGSERWIVTLLDSEAAQGNIDGTLHANREGNEFQRDRMVAQVRNHFTLPSGGPRPPR
ncbi:MAG: GDSL-type esterase/lipase family protein [Acidimicrobiales bacterium]